MNVQVQLQEGERELARMWKFTALRGALAIAFAVVILIWPSIGLTALIALFGAFALVSGIGTIVAAFNLPARGGERAWLVVEGLLGIAIGGVVFVWPGLSALGLLYAIAAWAIAMGVFEIALAFVLPLSGGRSLLVALGGLLSVAFGVIMFGHPGAGAVALLALIAAFAFVTGVMQIAFALELRGVVAKLERRIRPHVTAKPVTHGWGLTVAERVHLQGGPRRGLEPSPALVQHAEQRAQSIQNRIADRITAFAGSMWFVYIHIAWFGCWIGFGVENYPYGLLTMIVSLEAIFLSTFVMISQNRADEKRLLIADQQWQTVQEEDRQNEELLALSRQILDLTKAIHAGTTERPAAK